MAKLTVSAASRVTGASRMLLYRYIKTDKLSRTPEGLLDTAELLRVVVYLQPAAHSRHLKTRDNTLIAALV